MGPTAMPGLGVWRTPPCAIRHGARIRDTGVPVQSTMEGSSRAMGQGARIWDMGVGARPRWFGGHLGLSSARAQHACQCQEDIDLPIMRRPPNH